MISNLTFLLHKSPPRPKTMASPLSLPSLQSSVAHKSNFLTPKPNPVSSSPSSSRHLKLVHLRTNAKFNLSEILGGRGLCNGEMGIEKELKREPEGKPEQPTSAKEPSSAGEIGVDEESFDKEMFGLTGGFPGGEKGLQKFIEKNPPPPKAVLGKATEQNGGLVVGSMKKSKAPELPLLLPGMIVIVKNPKNPFHMYCGIVQRITDGKAGVLFEGGNWDRLVTFRLEELERREKGPPMVNPQSAILEGLVEKEA